MKKITNRFNLLEYIYYKSFFIYKKYEQKIGTGGNKNSAGFLISGVVLINFFTLLGIIDTFILNKLISKSSYFLALLISGGISIHLYFFFYYVRQYHTRIIEKYRDEKPSLKRIRGIISIVYIILSLVSVLAIVYFASPNPNL